MTDRARDQVAAPNGVCEAEWGVCTEHGNALVSSEGRSWCAAKGCGRRWDHDRLARHCREPEAFLVQVGAVEFRLCAGHTIAARQELRGVTVEPVTSGEEERS